MELIGSVANGRCHFCGGGVEEGEGTPCWRVKGATSVVEAWPSRWSVGAKVKACEVRGPLRIEGSFLRLGLTLTLQP